MSTWFQQSKSMCPHGSKSGVKNETPKSPETRESFGKIGIFLLLKSNFPHTKFNFLQRLSAFFNGFLLSSMDFWFSSRAFRFPRNPRKSIYGGKYTKDHYLSFVFPATHSQASKFPLTNCHSPHSLASVKDMYVEMLVSLCSTVNNTDCNMMHLNLYQQCGFTLSSTIRPATLQLTLA